MFTTDMLPPAKQARSTMSLFINYLQGKSANGQFVPGSQWWPLKLNAKARLHFPHAFCLPEQLGLAEGALGDAFGKRNTLENIATEFPLVKVGNLKNVAFITVLQRGDDGNPFPCGCAPTDDTIAVNDSIGFLGWRTQLQSTPPTFAEDIFPREEEVELTTAATMPFTTTPFTTTPFTTTPFTTMNSKILTNYASVNAIRYFNFVKSPETRVAEMISVTALVSCAYLPLCFQKLFSRDTAFFLV
jgi:hypothetical protein